MQEQPIPLPQPPSRDPPHHQLGSYEPTTTTELNTESGLEPDPAPPTTLNIPNPPNPPQTPSSDDLQPEDEDTGTLKKTPSFPLGQKLHPPKNFPYSNPKIRLRIPIFRGSPPKIWSPPDFIPSRPPRRRNDPKEPNDYWRIGCWIRAIFPFRLLGKPTHWEYETILVCQRPTQDSLWAWL